MRLAFKSLGFEYIRLLSMMWVGLIQSAEDLNRKKTDFLREEGIAPSDHAGLQPATYLAGFELASLFNHMSQFLKITLPAPPSIHPS